MITSRCFVSGERPFVCDECGLGFTQKGNLSRHKQTHQDSKPFKCDQCNYATKRKDALITHKSTHYLNKRYKCTYCSQVIILALNLKDRVRFPDCAVFSQFVNLLTQFSKFIYILLPKILGPPKLKRFFLACLFCFVFFHLSKPWESHDSQE